jgi:RNA polymerase-interacting CarD/CdnL/TRCF family regulator
MNYKIGDTVVHWTYGVGSVIAIEKIQLAGMINWYYVVEFEMLELWVPVDDAAKGSLRFPMESTQFRRLLDILHTPGQPLPDRYFQRKIALRERMQKRSPEALCQVIRDLRNRSHHHRLTFEDSTVLLSAEEYLLDEWVISLGTERSKALQDLEVIFQ